jgi:hypothetical protein
MHNLIHMLLDGLPIKVWDEPTGGLVRCDATAARQATTRVSPRPTAT